MNRQCDIDSLNSTQQVTKRGRKTKAVSLTTNASEFTDAGCGPSKPVAAKRGRKPKYVYNTYEAEQSIANSDDENVILKLNINQNTQDDISVMMDNEDISMPDAYNYASYDPFLKPCDIDSFSVDDSVTSATGFAGDMNGCSNRTKPACPNNIQCGSKLKVVKLLKDFEEKNKNNEWPNTTSIHCYWCCHRFETPPFGIPLNYVDNKFRVYGCFCSLECASAYNFEGKDSADEILERNNYINMLSRSIGYKNVVKPAPNRLALKMFGGHMCIEEFRRYCESSKLININFPPMMTLTQQIEEINESDTNNDYRYIPIDTDRINKYKERMRLRRCKPITEFKNTLDHAMNLKIDHA